jgi:hypothetical protein
MPRQPTQDRDAGRAVLDAPTRTELKRVTVLFLLSAITLLLFFVYLLAEGLGVSFIPPVVWAMWLASLFSGFVATWVYGVYVTARARRWLWVALCALPPTAVPCAVAYACIRRGEMEAELHERRGRGAG